MMKKLICFLLLIVSVVSCTQNKEKLPNQPWKDIVEINNNEDEPLTKWATDINVAVYGNTEADSVAVEHIINKVNALTETITIRFSKPREPSNFRLHFFGEKPFLGNKNIITRSRFDTNAKGNTSVDLHVFRLNENVFKELESRIANTIVTGHFFPSNEQQGKRPSIFNRTTNDTLTDEDKIIIKEVYTKGFEKRLKLAEKQFKSIAEEAKKERISQRKKTIWWVKNPIAVLILPTLLLALAFGFIIKKANNILISKIKKEWLRFGILALIALLFLDILIVLCISFYDFLTIPDDYSKAPLIRFDTLLTTTASLFVLVFPFLFLLRFIELKIRRSSQNLFIKTGLIFVSTSFLPFIILLLLVFFTSTESLNNGIYHTLSRAFVFLMVIASIRALISYFIFKERSLIIENETKLSKLRELKSKAELKSLQSQINPHFLYNSLNSIASLAPIDANKTQKMAHSLSDLFKYSINRKGKKMSTVKDEIEMVTSYLNIEKIRFGNRLQFDIEVDETLMNNEIPLFLIQPLVENAVKHGISQNEGEGTIRLKIEKVDNQLVISVNDNGPDFPEGLVSGHGLQTVYDLLRLSYNDSAALHWTNTPKKTITITIPETI